MHVVGVGRGSGSVATLTLDMPCHPPVLGGALQGQRNDEGQHDCHSTQASAAGPAHMWLLQCHCRERLHTPRGAAGVNLAVNLTASATPPSPLMHYY